jgi:hypothetical protein
MTLVLDRDQVAQMYEVAKDDELAILNTLAERAGLRWTCQPKPEHDHPWTNYPDEACGRCERSQQEAATHDKQTNKE